MPMSISGSENDALSDAITRSASSSHHPAESDRGSVDRRHQRLVETNDCGQAGVDRTAPARGQHRMIEFVRIADVDAGGKHFTAAGHDDRADSVHRAPASLSAAANACASAGSTALAARGRSNASHNTPPRNSRVSPEVEFASAT